MILIFIFLGSKIKISIAIIKEASRSVSFLFKLKCDCWGTLVLYVLSCDQLLFPCCSMPGCNGQLKLWHHIHRAVFGIPTSVIYPVFSWALLTVLFIYWAAVALYPSHQLHHSPMTLHTLPLCTLRHALLSCARPTIPPSNPHHITWALTLTPHNSFLLSSSTKYYAVITNTSIAPEHLNITGLGVVTNGTQCNPNVCCCLFYFSWVTIRATMIMILVCMSSSVSDMNLNTPRRRLVGTTCSSSLLQSTPWVATNPIIVPSNISKGNASISCYFNSFVTSKWVIAWMKHSSWLVVKWLHCVDVVPCVT